MLTTHVADSSHVKSVPRFWHFLLFLAHHHTGSVPLRHDTGERNCSVTPDSLLWFCVWVFAAKPVSQSSTSWEHPRSWKHLAIVWIFSKGKILIISLTIASSAPFTLLSLSLALACSTKSTVISALRPSSVTAGLLSSFYIRFFFFCTSLVSP